MLKKIFYGVIINVYSNKNGGGRRMNDQLFGSKHEIVKRFSYQNSSDLHVQNIGYNDFDYIKPIKWIHRQLGFTVHFVLEGSGILFIHGKEYNITENQLFFVEPGVDHMYYPDEENKWKYIWIYFSGTRAEKIAEDMGFSVERPVIDVHNVKGVRKILTDLIREADEGNINEYKAKGAFFSVVGEAAAVDAGESFAGSCAEDAAKLLATNFAKSDFSLDVLCRMLYISHSTLCKAFKETFDITPLKYLIQLRMNNATKLLSQSDISVRDVAELSGYRDEIHFMKTFKSYFGITATEYRKQMLKNKTALD